MTDSLNVHVLYEHGATDPRPFGSAHLRLLRPLSHPAVGDVTVTSGRLPPPDDIKVDCVVVDRLWRRGATPDQVETMVRAQQTQGRIVVAAMDDDLLLLDTAAAGLPPDAPHVAETILRVADGLMLTTPVLADRLRGRSANIQVVPNALDERLLAPRAPRLARKAFRSGPLIVGIMGTRTHDHDLDIIRRAWALLNTRRSDIRLEIVGAVQDQAPWTELGARFLTPRATETEYPLFMPWWSSEIDWDVGLAPLADTPFNAAKSDVKALDLAAVCAAGIFSRVPAYEQSVADGETGLLVENTPSAWAAAIERLASDTDLSVKVARHAARDLWTRRILAHRAPDWASALRALVATARGQSAPDTAA